MTKMKEAHMHMMLKTGAVAAALIGAVAMTATPSEARCRGCGAAAAGFVGGLAVGAIAANANNGYSYGPSYGYGYGYGYEPGYAYYGGPAYYGSYAYAPAPRYHRYYGSTRSATDHEALMSR
jgi:hypothetical protein